MINTVGDTYFSFEESGIIDGAMNEITPEFIMRLGFASASVEHRILVAYSNCAVCRLLANSFIAGAASCGAQITEADAEIYSVMCYISRAYIFNLAVFIEYDNGGLKIRMTDKFGLPLPRTLCKKIQLSSSAHERAPISDIHAPKGIAGVPDMYAEELSGRYNLGGMRLSVEGKSKSSEILRSCLRRSGAVLVSSAERVPVFSVSEDGMSLQFRDEKSEWYDAGHAQAILAFLHFLSGSRELAVFPSAPAISEQIADDFGGRVLRIGRDDGARDTFITHNSFHDAISAVLFICSYLKNRKKTLSEISVNIPSFTLISREVNLNKDRKAILDAIAKSRDGLHKEQAGCLRVCADGGWVSISPSRSKSSLRITGEGVSEEIASELCNLFVEKALTFDSSLQN